MATNEILPFAQGGGALVQSQAGYTADAQRPLGNQPGVARADFVNKVLRQASVIGAGLAQFLADKQATNITDALLPAAMSTIVQNAIRAMSGGYAAVRAASGTETLTAADMGKLVIATASGYTLTLPLANTYPSGASIAFRMSTSGVINVARQGADVIAAGNGSDAILTIPMRNGEDLTLVSNGVNTWFVGGGIAGKAISGNSSLPFGHNLSLAPGYARLGTGLMMQWDQPTFGSAVGNITFPIAFPNSCVGLCVADWGSTATFQGVATSVTTTGATGVTFSSTPAVFNYFAMGF